MKHHPEERDKMSFYVALSSHANWHEFPKNQANSFKIRLPHPLHLPRGQWQVGLSAVSLPDTRVNMYDLLKKGNYILNTRWIQDIPPFIKKESIVTFQTTIDDLKDLDRIVDGVSFMKAAIIHVEQQRRAKAVLGGKFVNGSGQHTYVKFSWEGEDLVIDNTNICHCGPSSTPSFSVHTKLALKMGWIVLSSTHSSGFTLGPNLQQTFLQDQVPTMAPGSGWNNLIDTSGNPQFWAVNKRHYLDLSMSCSWRFTNLNTAFRSIVGEPTRSLHVYSDVCGSIVVGNRVTDLLREVMYQRKGRGSVYFEPTHIQYIPLRKEVVDTVEINVAETNGDLAKFGPGNTIVTLHFKKT